MENGKILHKLLLCITINKNIFPLAKYVLVRMANLLGPKPYMHLICQNNAYLQTLAMIPVLGCMDSMLNYTILVNRGTLGTTQTIHKILMSTNWWCMQIKPMQTQGRMLLITTKSNLDTGCQWLDANLMPIFQHYLPKNPNYIPNPDNPLPHQADI